MDRGFKLALFASIAAHAMLFALGLIVADGESRPLPDDPPRIVTIVPVTEDFVGKAAEPAPPPPMVQPPSAPVITKPESPPTLVKPPDPPAPKKEVAAQTNPEGPKALPLTPPPPVAAPATTSIPAVPSPVKTGAIGSIPQPVASLPPPGAAASPVLITGRVKYRRFADPVYPPLAKRRHQQGTVLLDVTIAPDGKALSIDVKQTSSFPALDHAAVDAAKQWEFDVQSPVPLRAEVPVRFQLSK